METLPIDCRGLSSDQLLLLNKTCQCISLNTVDTPLNHPPANGEGTLDSYPHPANASDRQHPSPRPSETETQPPLAASHMFASTAVFVTQSELSTMQLQIDAIEASAALPRYRDLICKRGDIDLQTAQSRTRGLLMSYDFHLTPNGPRLIEVNTNAGGAFIMHSMLSGIWRRVSPCNNDTLDNPESIENDLVKMFIHEWQLAGRSGTPATVAIVDSNPQSQFLYPDMQLAKSMLERHNIQVVICSPESLSIHKGHLYNNKSKIDFVYNRSTDFNLSASAQQTLNAALLNNYAVVSPAPAHHALFADKRNLAIWRNQMQSLGAGKLTTEVLANLPETQQVTRDQETLLWKRRKQLFFKPNAGYGGKAAYRGDKLTRKVWKHIINGGYIAQSLEPPALRIVGENDNSTLMKFDLRLYTYSGKLLLSAARVYQGQTTNFRTPGGGFAPVVYLD